MMMAVSYGLAVDLDAKQLGIVVGQDARSHCRVDHRQCLLRLIAVGVQYPVLDLLCLLLLLMPALPAA